MAVCTRRAANPVVAAQGPWGSRRIVEGIGFGALTHRIEKLKSHKPSVGEAQAVIRQVLEEMAPHEFQINLDAEKIAERLLILEMTTIPLVGPNLLPGPNANPSARIFE
jgi:hypothetical protein